MLCDSCIKELALDTSREAPRVLKALLKNGQLNKREIKDKAGLSYAVNQRVVGELESKKKDISDILEAQREKFNQHYLKVHEQIERRWQRWEEGASTKEKSSESQVSGSRGSVNQGSPRETKSSSDMSHRIEL